MRQLKVLAFMGTFACFWHEKLTLEKKWNFYNRFYPEPTQLQRSLVTEAQMYREREAMGVKEESIQEKAHIDPDTQKRYE